MGQIGVSFKGIHRDTNDAVCKDGECMQLYNATATKEGVKMMPGIVSDGQLSISTDHAYYHAPSSTYIYISGSDPTKAYYTSDLTQAGTELAGTSGATGVTFVGNIACIATDSGIDYQLWKSGEWNNLGRQVPIPKIHVSSVDVHTHRTDGVPASSSEEDKHATEVGLWSKACNAADESKEFIDRALFRAAVRLFDGSVVNVSPAVCAELPYLECSLNKGFSAGGHSLTLVYKAIEEGGNDFNQSYIAGHTSRMRDSASASAYGYEEDVGRRVAVVVTSFSVELSVECDGLDDWKDLISGIDVFTTGSINSCHVGNKINSSNDIYQIVDRYKKNEYDAILRNTPFRLFRSYDSNMNLEWEADNYGQSYLQVEEALDDSTIDSVYSPNISYVYNSRLHIADYSEILSVKYNPSDYIGMEGLSESDGYKFVYREVEGGSRKPYFRVRSLDLFNNGYRLQAWMGGDGDFIYTRCSLTQGGVDWYDAQITGSSYIYDEDGEYTGEQTIGGETSVPKSEREEHSETDYRLLKLFGDVTTEVTIDTTDGEKVISGTFAKFPHIRYAFNSFVSHPDMRTKKMRFFVTSGEMAYDNVSFDLVQMGTKNLSYYFDAITSYVRAKVAGQVPSGESSSTIHTGNVVKVSAVDNPFVFPSAQAYTVGNGTITDMMSNTTALSEGQHGRNPLYVFTDEGVKALVVDATGKLVYSGVDEVSRDVLTNARAMCGTDNAVVFATSRGIMMAAGRKTVCLSDALDGDDSFLIDGILDKLFGSSAVYDYGHSVNFRTYISGDSLRIGYDYDSGHVYVSNPGAAGGRYRYCYVYDTGSGEWSKRSGTILGFVDTYPVYRAIAENLLGQQFLVHLNNLSTTNGESLLLMSRPMKLGTLGRKKLNRFALTAKIRQTGLSGTPDFEDYKRSTTRIGVYVLGSNDGFGWQICSYKETARPFNLLAGNWSRGNSYRYFVVVVKGSLRTNSIVDGITLDADAVFNSSLAF